MNMIAKNEFEVGKHTIGWLDPDFFGKYFGKEDSFAPATKMPTYWTMKDSDDRKDAANEADPRTRRSTLGEVAFFMDNAPEECKDGRANIFYLDACVLRLYWLGSDWYVHARERDGVRWSAGRRVFSPATDAPTPGAMHSGSMASDAQEKPVLKISTMRLWEIVMPLIQMQAKGETLPRYVEIELK